MNTVHYVDNDNRTRDGLVNISSVNSVHCVNHCPRTQSVLSRDVLDQLMEFFMM